MPSIKIFVNYIKSSIEELKKVSWPTKQQVWQGTLLVIGLSLFVSFYLGFLDYIFNILMERFI